MTYDTEPLPIGWDFWLRWVIASSAALAVGFWVSSVVTAGGYAAIDPDSALADVVKIILSAVTGAILGTSLGIAQWLVSWRQISRAGRWVLATIAGSTGGLAVGEAVFGTALDSELYAAMAFIGILAVFGASVGTGQWLVLRRQISRAGWWVLASIAGSAGGLAVLGIAGIPLSTLVFWFVPLFGYPAITGGVLVWLFRQPVTEESSPPQVASANLLKDDPK